MALRKPLPSGFEFLAANSFRSRFSSAKSDAYNVHALVRILFAQPVIKHVILQVALSFLAAGVNADSSGFTA
jgi:hypothetical protein